MTLDFLLRMPAMTPEQLAQRVAVMTRQDTQLTQLVDDLMDAAHVSQGKVELRLQRIDLNEVVAEALELSGGAVSAKEFLLTLHPLPRSTLLHYTTLFR